jgi:hypothetical protein
MTPTDAPLRVIEKSDALAEAALPPPPAAAPAPHRQSITVPLVVPIEAHGERLTQLTLRPIKVEDIEACDLSSGEKITARAISECLVRLAGVPRSSILQLDPADYYKCSNALALFLAPLDRTS